MFNDTCLGIIRAELRSIDYIDLLKRIDADGKITLHCVCTMEVLRCILPSSISPENLFDLLALQDSRTGSTILHSLSCYNMDLISKDLISILQHLHPGDLPHLFAILDYKGTTLLRAIVGRSQQNLSLVMAMIPSHLRLPVIAAQDTYPMMVGLGAEVILNFLSGDERIKFVTATDAAGNSYLHSCAQMMNEIEHLLTRLPKETLVSILLAQNFEGNTPLHKLYYIETVIPILEYLMTPFQVDQLFSLRNSDGNTILHGVNPHKVLEILAKLKLPANSFLGIQNGQGQTILHQTVDISHSTKFYEPVDNPLLVAKILSFVNVAQRASILMLKDLKSNTVLHMIDYKLPEAIISVLHSVPYEERGKLLRIQDQGGRTPIHLIVSMAYHQTLLQVLRLFSASQIVQLLSCQDNNGSTFHTSPYCSSFSQSITCLPSNS